jgi:hypothetical protein
MENNSKSVRLVLAAWTSHTDSLDNNIRYFALELEAFPILHFCVHVTRRECINQTSDAATVMWRVRKTLFSVHCTTPRDKFHTNMQGAYSRQSRYIKIVIHILRNYMS